MDGDDGAALVSVLLFSDAGGVIVEVEGPALVSFLLDWLGVGEVSPAPEEFAFVGVLVLADVDEETELAVFVLAVELLLVELLLLLPQPLKPRVTAMKVHARTRVGDSFFIGT